MEFKHTPVLLEEVIDGLKINPSGFYLDCTLGGAGHSSEILKRLTNGVLIGFDKDSDAINASFKRLKEIGNAIIYNSSEKINIAGLARGNKPACVLIKSDFKDAVDILNSINCPPLDGILIDLGVSSHQIDTPERGFSFRMDAKLDMRMDQSQPLTAKEIVNSYSEDELRDLFYKYGEEEFSKSIARNIIKYRSSKEILTTRELNEIIENSMPKKVVFSRGGASKKVFQALRIEVNSELSELDSFLKNSINLLKKRGRICVISFHSLEDRIVKTTFKELATNCICPSYFPKCVCGGNLAKISLVNKKPICASVDELSSNSRSSSAKLRIAEKT